MWDDGKDMAIVIDNGSGMVRASYAGEGAPRVEFPNLVGRFESDSMGDTEC